MEFTSYNWLRSVLGCAAHIGREKNANNFCQSYRIVSHSNKSIWFRKRKRKEKQSRLLVFLLVGWQNYEWNLIKKNRRKSNLTPFQPSKYSRKHWIFRHRKDSIDMYMFECALRQMLVSITDNIRYHEYNHMKRISRFGAIERLILRFGCCFSAKQCIWHIRYICWLMLSGIVWCLFLFFFFFRLW